jgi:hypothetical protein
VKAHAALVEEAMPLQIAWLSTTTFAGCCAFWDVILLLGIMVLIALANSVATRDFVILIPCVVSILLLASWLIILAFTITGMVFLTLVFARNIVLSILLRTAFLTRAFSWFNILKLFAWNVFVVWILIVAFLRGEVRVELVVLELVVLELFVLAAVNKGLT